MNTTCCAATIPLSRPWHERALDRIGDGLRRMHAAWRRHAEARRRERELQALADLDELMLRDIGAPEWMIQQAGVRRDSQRQRLDEMTLGHHLHT